MKPKQKARSAAPKARFKSACVEVPQAMHKGWSAIRQRLTLAPYAKVDREYDDLTLAVRCKETIGRRPKLDARLRVYLTASSAASAHTAAFLALPASKKEDLQKRSLPGTAHMPASTILATESGRTHARAATTIRRKWMADQPSFAAQLLLWVTIIVLINVLLVTLATSAAGQLVPTATTSAQHAAVSLHNAASVSATACRIALPTVTPSVKHWAAAARLRTKIVMGIVLLLLGMVPACVIAVAKEIRRILTNFATLCWLGFWSLVEHAVRAVTKLGLFFQASFAAAASTSYNIAVSAVRNLTVTAASAKCLVMNTARFSSSMATSAHRVLWLRLCSRTHEDLPALWLHLDCLAHILLTLVTLETCVALLARHTFLPCGNLVALYALSLLADIMSMPDLCGRVAAVPASASAMLSSAGHGIQSATADAAHSLACLSCRVLAGCVPACTSAHTALLLLTTQAETLWPGCLQLAPLLLLSIPLLGFAGHVLYLLLLPAARTVLFLYITAWLTVPIQPGACAPVTVWAHATAAHVCRGLGLPACHTPQATANKATVVSEPASPIAGPWTFAGQEHFKVWHNPMFGRGGSTCSWPSLSYPLSTTLPVPSGFSWPDARSPLVLAAVPATSFSSSPLTQHEILRIDTQEGGTSALCDEPNQDQMRDSASLLGSQIGNATVWDTLNKAPSDVDLSAAQHGWGEVHQHPVADPITPTSQIMSEGSNEAAVWTAECGHGQLSEVSATAAGFQGGLDMHATRLNGAPWTRSPEIQEVMSGQGLPEAAIRTNDCGDHQLPGYDDDGGDNDQLSEGWAVAPGSQSVLHMHAARSTHNPWSSFEMTHQGRGAVWDAWNQSEAASDLVSSPTQDGWGEVHQHPAAYTIAPSAKVVSDQRPSDGAIRTNDCGDHQLPGYADDGGDNDQLSEGWAVAPGSQSVLHMHAARSTHNPWSSFEMTHQASQSRQPQAALPSAAALEAKLQAVSAEKVELQQQLTASQGRLWQTRLDLWRTQDALSELEGQVAYDFWTSRPSLMRQGDCSSSLPAQTSVLASPEQDLWARRRYRVSTGQDKVGDWNWTMSDFSSTAQVLAPSEAGAAIFGTGSTGEVLCGRLVLDSSQVVAAAFKRVAFDTAAEQTRAKAELSALKDLADGPNSVQCFGAFDYCCPADGKRYLQIAMECVHGISYREAYQLVVVESYSADRHYAFAINVLKRLLEALSWSHARGRAHCDLKLDNLAFCMDCEAGGVSYIRLMDHGGSIRYAGMYCKAPMGFSFNVLTASPEVARGSLGAIGERIDGCAHDCWGVGCMAFRAFANLWPFYCPPTGSQEQDYENLRNSHNSWAESYKAPEPLHPDAHFLLEALYAYLGDWERYLSVATLLRRLLHPDIGERATVHDALASELFV